MISSPISSYHQERKRSSKMKPAMMALGIAVTAFLLLGCGDGDPNYPIGDGGWHLKLDVGRFPDNVEDYPLFITIEAQLIDLSTGADPPDGTVLVFRASDGTFENGLPDVEMSTVGGRAETTFRADHPGRYEVSVEYPVASSTAVTTFTVGL